MFEHLKVNWKTTAAGIALTIIQLLPYFNINLDPEIVKAATIILGGGGLVAASDPNRSKKP